MPARKNVTKIHTTERTSLYLCAVFALVAVMLIPGGTVKASPGIYTDGAATPEKATPSQFPDLGAEAPYAVHSTVLQSLPEPVDRWQLPGFALGAQMAPPWADKPGAPPPPSRESVPLVPSANLTYLSAQWSLQHPASYPSPRTGAAMAYDTALNEVVLFGGHSATSYLNDVWTYKAGVWTNITAGVSNLPSPRYDALMAYDDADGYLLLVGGFTVAGGAAFQNDSWVFYGNTWQSVASVPVSPWTDYWNHPIYYGPDMTYDPALEEVVFVGTFDDDGNTNGNGLVWGYHTGKWSALPSPDRCNYLDPLAYDTVDGYLLSVGGNDSYQSCKLTSSGWVMFPFSSSQPVFGGYEKDVYDSAAQTVILPLDPVSPYSCSTPYTCPQTWAFNGGTWTNISSLSPLKPSQRTEAAITYDASDGLVLYFGGANRSTMLGDTWTLLVTTSSSLSTLTSVAVSPIAVTLNAGGTQSFTATPTCTAACPSGTTYTWSLSMNGYGTLSQPTGSPVIFTAGNAAGTVNLTVTATLNGVTKQSAPAAITIYGGGPTGNGHLSSVAVSPPSATLNTSTTAVFFATPTCTGGPCPTGINYSWSLTNALGRLNATWTNPVIFTAGSLVGTVDLFVDATYCPVPDPCEVVQSAPVTITISGGRPTGNGLAVYMADSPASGVAPLTVDLIASASGGSEPYTFLWNFGDGSSVATGTSVSHTYTAAGTYAVTLTGSDARGEVSQTTSTIVVYPAPTGNESGAIELAIGASPVTGPAPLDTTFTASASGGSGPYTYAWEFGDGSTGAGLSVAHTYTSPGEYVTLVVVTDTSGNEASSGIFITVTGTGGGNQTNDQLAAFATALDMHGSAPLTVTFSPAVRGGTAPYTLSWDFGDGATTVTYSLSPVTHTYAAPGSYVPKFTVTDAKGKSVTWTVGTPESEHPIVVTGGTSPQGTSLFTWVVLALGVVVVAALLMAVIVKGKRKELEGADRAAPSEERLLLPPLPPQNGAPKPPPGAPSSPPVDPFLDNL